MVTVAFLRGFSDVVACPCCGGSFFRDALMTRGFWVEICPGCQARAENLTRAAFHHVQLPSFQFRVTPNTTEESP